MQEENETIKERNEERGEKNKQRNKESVGKHERADAVIIREDLPKTMIGKLDRKALRAEVLD